MESILEWCKTEGMIFKGGSGSGINLSRIRSSREQLSAGGIASRPGSMLPSAAPTSTPGAEQLPGGASARNPASLNLLKFLDEGGRFDVEAYRRAVATMIWAQE